MEEKKYCVYVHTNKTNEKKYVGQTCQFPPEKRWGPNGRNYLVQKNGRYVHSYFANAILKYGWDGFEHTILKSNLDEKEAEYWEKYYIRIYASNTSEKRYNLTDGGLHHKMSDEAQKRRIEKMSGENHHFYRKHLSEEMRNNISQALKGRKLSKEQKENISKGLRGRKLTSEQRRNISEGIKESKNKKRAAVMCLETEIVYLSARHAFEATGISSDKILDCCNWPEKHHSAGGFHWIKVDNIDKENWEKQKEKILNTKWTGEKGKKVWCIETEKIYDTIAAAQRDTGIDSSSIARCCRGKSLTARKKHWVFIQEEGEQVAL